MFIKAVALLAPVALGGMWIGGVFDAKYDRVVDRSPAQVMQALSDLDVRREPGAPGSEALVNGVHPLFRTERTENSINYVVMSGDQVATTMTAHLEPLDGGKRTRVTASVERGNAPDDFVSPAFRSRGLTLGLFSMALEDELNQLVAPPQRSLAECRELAEGLLTANAPAHDNRDTLAHAMASTARQVMALSAVEAELRRRGCPTNGHAFANGNEFQSVHSEMREADRAPDSDDPSGSVVKDDGSRWSGDN